MHLKKFYNFVARGSTHSLDSREKK